MKLMISTFIFDFDGIIADTMKDNCEAWKNSLMSFGVVINDIDYYLLEGMGRFQIARFFSEKYGISKKYENEIVDKKESYYAKHNKFKVYPEILLILDYLERKNIKLALVTGASRKRLKETLDDNIYNKFSVIITGDDVVNSKPDPEPYLKAISKLNVKSKNCIVVENALLGIKSAKTSKCFCIAIETTLSKEYLQEADIVFENHNCMFEYITKNI